MTVKELIEVSPFCDMVEVVVREHGHGKWVQGYRIGKEAKLYPSNLTAALRERFNIEYGKPAYLEKGQEIDVKEGRDLPLKVICKDVRKIPEYIANLKVCDVQPRHIPQIHKERLTHNEFSYEVNCYPDGYVPSIERPQEETNDNQISIEEYMNE